MGTESRGYFGIYVFIGVIIAVVALLLYFKIKWSNEDRKAKLGDKARIEKEKAADVKRN
jgi:uncharacterized membrane protein